MGDQQKHTFKAVIYKTGINFAVDVPADITARLVAKKGYIRVKGTVNGFAFTKSLVPVKNALYRLFVNVPTLKGANAQPGDTAKFVIQQDREPDEVKHPMSPQLQQQLTDANLLDSFESLTPSRKKEILRYLNNIKTPETLQKQTDSLLGQLQQKSNNVRIP